MTLVTEKLRDLASTLADLKDRVRAALAGELAKIVAEAVRDVVHTVLRREPRPAPRPTWSGYAAPSSYRDPPDPWADDPWEDRPTPVYAPASPTPPVAPAVRPEATLAAAAGLAVARWWARRTGRLAAAV